MKEVENVLPAVLLVYDAIQVQRGHAPLVADHQGYQWRGHVVKLRVQHVAVVCDVIMTVELPVDAERHDVLAGQLPAIAWWYKTTNLLEKL